MIPRYKNFFDNAIFLKRQRGPWGAFLQHEYCVLHPLVYRDFPAQQIPETFRTSKRASSEVSFDTMMLWNKKKLKFFVIPPCDLPIFSRPTNGQRRLWAVLSLLIIIKEVSHKKVWAEGPNSFQKHKGWIFFNDRVRGLLAWKSDKNLLNYI